VDAVLRLALGEGLGYADLPGLRVVREQGRLRIGGKEPIPIEERVLHPGGDLFVREAGLVIRSRIIPDCSEVHSS
jgi:hypothetical protein